MRSPSDPQIVSAPFAPASSGVDSAVAREILRRFHALPEPRLALLRQGAEVARACDCELYWIGGGVRDLWLGTSELDIDLVVAGDLTLFADRLAAAFGSGLRTHPQFLTAELAAPGGFRLDLAQIRSERYAAPAALPQVAPGTFAGDFARRDFTINCLAIPLAPAFGERLLDPCGGLADLECGCLRILHETSFRDDPTRILRGLEFAARFGFDFSGETLQAARRAVADGTLARLSPGRLGEALRRALGRGRTAGTVLRRMHDLALLAAIESGLEGAADASALVERAQEAFLAATGRHLESAFRLSLICLAGLLDDGARHRFAKRLALPATEHARVIDGPARVTAAARVLAKGPTPSAAHASLAGLSEEELALVAAQGVVARAWVRREWNELRALRLQISGRELLAAGVPAGPAVGRALAATHAALLDGDIQPEDELEHALRLARLDPPGGCGASS